MHANTVGGWERLHAVHLAILLQCSYHHAPHRMHACIRCMQHIEGSAHCHTGG